MKILVCGDSYCVTDPAYPNLHWTEKIVSSSSSYEIINLAYGGCSNTLIALQLMQGLRFDPDFVIFSFTSNDRYEFDRDSSAVPTSLTQWDIASYLKDRYTTSTFALSPEQEHAYKLWKVHSSDDLERIKNYFYICFCLMTVKSRNIKFCYSLGGFEFQQDYAAFLNRSYLKNLFFDFQNNQISTNLWYHGQKSKPFFHVDDDRIQSLFANECMERFHG